MSNNTPDNVNNTRILLTLIDDTPEFQRALKFACLRARRIGSHVGLLYVCEDSGFHHWMGVKDLARKEQREMAENIMAQYATKVLNWTALYPIFYIREGGVAEELLKLINEDHSIATLILGVSANSKSPGPIISHLVGKGKSGLHVPLTLVPPDMSDEEISALA